MSIRTGFLLVFSLLIIIVFPVVIFFYFEQFPKAAPQKASIHVNTRRITGIIPSNWKALAQGGEESGVRMLENVVPQVAALFPKYIRLDHIYDFYDVVGRDSAGNMTISWTELDQTICDIYRTGAKPFLSLGYMPPALSTDGTLISTPNSWEDWTLLVQRTIERYSGKSTRLCGGITGDLLSDTYYEVWNEPELAQFGGWGMRGGAKDYRIMYFYSSLGASRAENVNHFLLGGPSTASLLRNWTLGLLDYVSTNNLRLDFISWHHYSKNPHDYTQDVVNLNSWLFSDPKYEKYRFRQKIISEWGYDSDPNPISETNVGAAHTITSIRNLIEQNVSYAFAFDIKDGPQPRWGFLTNSGEKKPRYDALRLLNVLKRNRLQIAGEGTYVSAIASIDRSDISVVLVNYDQANKNYENVPVTFTGLPPGEYELTTSDLLGRSSTTNILTETGEILNPVIMTPNMIVTLELKPI